MITNSITGDIKYYMRHGNMVTKLIFVNVGVFIFFGVFYLLSFLGQSFAYYDLLLRKLEVPASLHQLALQPWSVFTYMFLHVAVFHILFNMLWLFWFGEIFVLYLGDKKVLPLYIISGLAGAAFYILAYNLIPVFKPGVNMALMLGASASIFGIAAAAATINPDHEVGIILLGPIRIKYIVLFFLLIDMIEIPYGNAGGYIAHLGGAITGWAYIKALRSGFDITWPFTGLYNFVSNIRRRRTVRIVYRKDQKTNLSGKGRGRDDQEKVDEILDKIARSGYDSLTREEKDFLFNYSKK